MSKNNHEDVAREVLNAEAQGIAATAVAIDARFSKAVETLLTSSGYLIVCGVGKSGHIGRKIAASFASTGTPAFFVHPTEASHGDLGMLMPNSVVLAISSSGESREMTDVLGFCQKNKIPVIAITKHSNSTLGRLSQIILNIPDIPEVSSNGLAPTTSTTNTLALGDALVVATMRAKGFGVEDFGRHHPGGKLGRRLQTVTEWIALHDPELPTVAHDTGMENLITAISSGQNGCVAVVDDDGNMIGIVTDGDLRRAMSPNFFRQKASDIMTPDPTTLSGDMLMREVVTIFTERKISNAFVTDNNKPVAVIHMKSLLREGYV